MLLFTIQSRYTIPELLTSFRDPITQNICFNTYISNLYDGEQPVNSKAWAHICFDSFYSNTTVQLTHVRILDSIEGDANYYYANNRWNAFSNDEIKITVEYTDATMNTFTTRFPKMPAITSTSASYAMYNLTSRTPYTLCRAHTVYNPDNGRCEPGCNNGNSGVRCHIPISELTTSMEAGASRRLLQVPTGGTANCIVPSFDEATMVYINYACTYAQCKHGYALSAFQGCVVDPNAYSAGGSDPQPVTVKALVDEVDTFIRDLITGFIIVTAVLLLFLLLLVATRLCRTHRRRRKARRSNVVPEELDQLSPSPSQLPRGRARTTKPVTAGRMKGGLRK